MKSEKDLHRNDFFERVYQVVRLIPESRVTTYGLIAAYLGSPQAGRMVGWAMNKAHNVQPPVPAHRVVNRNGVLTGKHHFCGEHVMEDLLKSEGVTVVNDNIMDFEKHLWNPREAL